MKSQPIPAVISLLLAGFATAKDVPTNAKANLVLGQSDFVSDTIFFPVSSFSTYTPYSVAVDPVSGKVFVVEIDGDRILRFPNMKALTNGAGAEAVFGQTSFSIEDNSTTSTTLADPNGVFLDRKGRLWVADSGNNRVVMYEAAIYRGNGPVADKVLGQATFTTSATAVTSNGMNSPRGVFVDKDDRLWVADTSNNRVLRFDSVSLKSNGSIANGVLGQTLFTTSTAGSGAAGLGNPTSISGSSTGALFVADRNNHRVVRFDNAAGIANGSNANAVFGQLDFANTSSGASASKLNSPVGVWVTSAGSLWVTDLNNNRILRFSAASTSASGANAKAVVGQPDFLTASSGLSSQKLFSPSNQAFVDGSGALWVADTNNQRVLRFPADGTKPTVKVSPAVPPNTSAKKITVKGTATDANGITLVQYKVNNGAKKNATGIANWQFKATLSPGKNKITIYVTDGADNISTKVVNVTRN